RRSHAYTHIHLLTKFRHRKPQVLPFLILSARLRRPPDSTLFPYTTLFRSKPRRSFLTNPITSLSLLCSKWRSNKSNCHFEQRRRSEEHTSELQSREKLVCRLLLEKKKRRDCH